MPRLVGIGKALIVARGSARCDDRFAADAGLADASGRAERWPASPPVAALLIYEHGLVKADDLSRVNAAFFTMNGWVSVLFFVFLGR